jgi:hypothetical protein
LDEILDNLYRSQRFFRAHLNGMREGQWDWKPYPACRSVREILLHWVEVFDDGAAALRAALEEERPDVARVQSLMREAGLRYGERFRARYADTPLDSRLPNGVAVATMLASLAAEDNYHAGQVAFIRLATDPTWDWVEAVHQTLGI